MQYYTTTYCFYVAAESKNGCCHRSRDEIGGYQRLSGQEALGAVGEGYSFDYCKRELRFFPEALLAS